MYRTNTLALYGTDGDSLEGKLRSSLQHLSTTFSF
jgi:hypothetical protein